MAQDTLLGFPAHTLPYIHHFIERLPPVCLTRHAGGLFAISRYFGSLARKNTSAWKIHAEVFCLYSAFLSPTGRRGTG